MAAAPAWLRTVVEVERAVGGRLAHATNSPQAAAALLALGRARRITANLRRGVGDRATHLLSLPSRRDVEALDAKVEGLHRLVEDVAVQLDVRHERTGRHGS